MSEANGSERRVLSSSQTFFVKFIGPALVAPMAAYLLFVDARTGAFLRLHHGMAPLALLPWLMIAGVFLFSLWWSFQLKRVAVDGDSIFISDYSQEVALPLSAIVDVRENRWLKMHPVTVEFDRDTPWGNTIRFMPKLRFFAITWMSHPVVAELRDSAQFARMGKRAAMGIGRDGDGDSGFMRRAPAFGGADRD